jgi:hypothetical protein
LSARRLLPIALLLLALTLPAASRAEVLQDLGATFEQVAQELSGAFPKVESRVVAVEGQDVRLEGPAVAALRPGLELTAYRKGAPFRHPITDQPLGHAEDEVAVLTVTAVSGTQATAHVATTEGGRRPEVGDGARITAGRIPVAVLPPLGVSVPGETAEETALLLVSRFSALLEKTGRFLAVEPRRVLEAANPPGGAARPSALEVAQRLRAPAVLVTRLVQEGRDRFLEVSWLSGRTGATLLASRTPLLRASFPPRFAWETTPELSRHYAIDGQIRGVAVADLDGDGRPELLLADDRAVRVYRLQDGSVTPAAVAEFRPGGGILSIDAADVNGVGRSQVVVVDHRGIGEVVGGTVLELRGEQFQTLYQVGRRFLRVVPVGGQPWLLEQDTGEDEPFGSTVRRLVWRDGRYRDGPGLAVPRGVTLYGLALVRLTGSADPDVVALTADDHLGVWTSSGRRLWTSAEPYGGAPVSFPFEASRGRNSEPKVGRVSGRLVVLPDSPEGPELLVFQNILPGVDPVRRFLPGLAPLAFNRGRIYRLRWRDGGFVRVWESQTTEGYVADFGYGDVDADGVPEVVVGVVPRGINLAAPFERGRSDLVLFDLP